MCSGMRLLFVNDNCPHNVLFKFLCVHILTSVTVILPSVDTFPYHCDSLQLICPQWSTCGVVRLLCAGYNRAVNVWLIRFDRPTEKKAPIKLIQVHSPIQN